MEKSKIEDTHARVTMYVQWAAIYMPYKIIHNYYAAA